MSDNDKLIDEFVDHALEEAAKLAGPLGTLDDSGRKTLGELLLRFDYKHTGVLDADERKLVYRVLSLLHRPSVKGLALLLGVFDFMDVNQNQTLEHQELTLAVEVLELFCKADSVNSTLSLKELNALIAMLDFLDKDHNGVLDEDERRSLHDRLWEPDALLAEQRDKNPAFRDALGLD